jgi:hypothetical protein
LNSTETQEEGASVDAQSWNSDAANLEIMAGILHALPSFNIHMTPMGCGVEVAWGMPNLAAGFSAQARQNQAYASDSTFDSSQAGRKAGYLRQYQVSLNDFLYVASVLIILGSNASTQSCRSRV